MIFKPILASFFDHFQTIFRHFFDIDFGIDFLPILEPFWIPKMSGEIYDQPPFWDPFSGMEFLMHRGRPLALFWRPFGSLLGSIWPPFGPLWRHFGSSWRPCGFFLMPIGSLLATFC